MRCQGPGGHSFDSCLSSTTLAPSMALIKRTGVTCNSNSIIGQTSFQGAWKYLAEI